MHTFAAGIGWVVIGATSVVASASAAIYLAWGPQAVRDAWDRWIWRRWP